MKLTAKYSKHAKSWTGTVSLSVAGSVRVVRGSPMVLISESGTLASANTYPFSSKALHVNSGFFCYGYRWYAPNLQRWLNRDQIEEPAKEQFEKLLEEMDQCMADHRWPRNRWPKLD